MMQIPPVGAFWVWRGNDYVVVKRCLSEGTIEIEEMGSGLLFEQWAFDDGSWGEPQAMMEDVLDVCDCVPLRLYERQMERPRVYFDG